jgi:hypothetical protein
LFSIKAITFYTTTVTLMMQHIRGWQNIVIASHYTGMDGIFG